MERARQKAAKALEDAWGNKQDAIQKLNDEAEEWTLMAIGPLPKFSIFTAGFCEYEAALCRIACDLVEEGAV